MTFVAKEGYAIGALRVNTDSYPRILGIQVVFMRIEGGQLNPKDYYLGAPYLTVPENTPIVGGDGRPIVGVYGSWAKQEQRGLGLVQVER